MSTSGTCCRCIFFFLFSCSLNIAAVGLSYLFFEFTSVTLSGLHFGAVKVFSHKRRSDLTRCLKHTSSTSFLYDDAIFTQRIGLNDCEALLYIFF